MSTADWETAHLTRSEIRELQRQPDGDTCDCAAYPARHVHTVEGILEAECDCCASPGFDDDGRPCQNCGHSDEEHS